MIRRMPILIIFVAVSIFLLESCHRETEADKVKKVVISMQKAAEQKDVKDVLSHVARNYRDPQGNDYQAIKNIMLYYFFRHQRISIFITNWETAVNGASAHAEFEAVLSSRSGQTGAILPEALGLYLFRIALAKDSGDWKITSAQWNRLGDAPAESAQEQ